MLASFRQDANAQSRLTSAASPRGYLEKLAILNRELTLFRARGHLTGPLAEIIATLCLRDLLAPPREIRCAPPPSIWLKGIPHFRSVTGYTDVTDRYKTLPLEPGAGFRATLHLSSNLRFD